MASLILNGSTSGSITISSPSVSGVNVLSLPANTGTVLTTASTFGGTGPAFAAYASAAQTVTLATATKVAIDTELFDTASCFDTSTYRFTPNVAGYYQVNITLRGFVATTFTVLSGQIFKNGSVFNRLTNLNTTFSVGAASQLSGSDIIYLNGTTDYIEFYGILGGTGTATISYNPTSTNTSLFSACLVRAE
jgi:hypothetical protein